MAKFLNKKEQVIDFQLTPYGKHRLSVGQLKPAYYAFFDTGVTYDSEYTGFKESQNKIHERIKTETHFIEGILLFEEAENSVPQSTWIGHSPLFEDDDDAATAVAGTDLSGDITLGGSGITLDSATMITPGASLFDLDLIPQRYIPKPEVLSFDSSIGDAKFEGDNTQAAPAWKIVACQGEMSNIKVKDDTQYNFSSASFDTEHTEFNIPQIDVDAYYTLLISSPSEMLQEETLSDFVSETEQFVGGNTIKLVRDDIMIYGEEVNTQLLTENFDVEVFEMIEDTGVVTMAGATVYIGSTGAAGYIDIGDTITISDGISTVIFEFIDNSRADLVRAGAFPEGRVGVVVSNNYIFASGTDFSRKGTIWNLMSAIRQDEGNTRKATFPTGNGFDPGCYVGNHNLRVQINDSEMRNLEGWNYATKGQYPLSMFNSNIDTGNPNQQITTTAASVRINTTGEGAGFSGGYVRKGTQLKRKHFRDAKAQIVDGLMTAANPESISKADLTTNSVEFFFDLLTDGDANGKIACSCANSFNKNSYYVDIDFDCTEEQIEEVYYDIYGSATSPEICDLPPTTLQELQALQPTEEPCEDD